MSASKPQNSVGGHYLLSCRSLHFVMLSGVTTLYTPFPETDISCMNCSTIYSVTLEFFVVFLQHIIWVKVG